MVHDKIDFLVLKETSVFEKFVEKKCSYFIKFDLNSSVMCQRTSYGANFTSYTPGSCQITKEINFQVKLESYERQTKGKSGVAKT